MTTPPDLRVVPGLPPGKLRVVITYLEMTSPPTAPKPRPPVEKLALLRAERPTVSFYRYLYNTVGEPWLWVDRRKLDDAALTAIIHDPKVEIAVLYVGGVPAGFAELDRRRGTAVDLSYFGMIPEFVGMRLGPFLLGCAIDAAWKGGAGKVTVNTCTLDHPKALRLYQRAGFTPVRQDVRIADDPRVTGLIPLDAAPQHPIVTS
ncbi:GNAT family N-acetyltransferase [Skermanella stibiiresistens]|uniref:GNAT family N-acetyltransferase n=1 Tax=Skermanella stibiiresistens TaxID=913326 RepID=UPI0004B7EB83|nr:GNAT family N-acetyltransferase [Skermanella stibiiresistens]